MLDGRMWRLVALTKDELCDVCGLLDYLEEVPGAGIIKGEELLKGEFLMYVPLNGQETWRGVEPDASLLDCYFVACMGHRILARICDGMLLEFRHPNVYKPHDSSQLVFKIGMDANTVSVSHELADVSGPGDDGIKKYYGVLSSWDGLTLEGTPDEQAETIAKLNGVWEEQRELLTIRPTEPTHYN